MPPRNPNRGVCPPDHPHDLTCYVTHKCGDDRCREVNKRYNRWLRERRQAGRRTAGQDVPAIGVIRRVRALNTLGWSTPVIFEKAGLGSRGRDKMRQEFVTVRTDANIRRVYNELWNQRPPETNMPERVSANRTRRAAARQGWPGPDAWIGVDIDDPHAEPDTTVAEDGPAWFLDELDHLRGLGESKAQALAALGITPNAAAKAARRHQRPDLARWIGDRERTAA